MPVIQKWPAFFVGNGHDRIQKGLEFPGKDESLCPERGQEIHPLIIKALLLPFQGEKETYSKKE